MKKFVAWLVMSLYCVVAFALPRPSQIEDALASKNYAEARGMVAEVLREKPDSARAHLLNAYLLAHVDHNKVAASTELQAAAGLDKRGDVKSSPLFGRVVAEIDLAPAKRPTSVGSHAPALAPVAQPAGADSDWALILLAVAIGAAISYFIFRRRPEVSSRSAFQSTAAPGRSFRESYPDPLAARAHPAPPAPAPYYPPAAPAPSSSALHTAAAVAGGVVAGNAMSAMLMGGHSSSRWDDEEAERRRRRARDDEDERVRRDSTSSTYYDPSPVSTSSERSSFSSSSSGSDSWSSSDSSSSSYDSGSSSSDFGSSSSDW